MTEAQVSERSTIGLQLVRHDLCRTNALVPQQFTHQSQGSKPIPALLNQDVENCALTINGSPQVHLLATNIYENFVPVPDVERDVAAFADPTGIGWPKFQNPQTNRFITDINTALCEEVFNAGAP